MTTGLEVRALAVPGRLQPVAFDAAPGELVALVGPNGSGKTSLLHALAGIAASTGEVRLDGQDPRRAPPRERARLIAFLPATRELHWPLPAADLVRLGGATEAQAKAAMETLELAAVAERRADRLSTGERNRVLLARAIAGEPRLLLLDEPTANLDPLWQIRVMERLKAIVAGGRQSAIVALHDLDAAGRHADRLLLMHEGRLCAEGPARDMLKSPLIAQVFGIERGPEGWRAAVRPEDRRSSP